MNNILRKVLSDSFIYSVLPRLSRLVSILILPLITRYLTPYDYGVVGVLFAYIHIFEGFSTLGFDVIFINVFFKQESSFKEVWGKLYGFLMVWAIPYGLLITPVVYIALPAEERYRFSSIFFYAIIPILLFDQTIGVGQKYLQMSKKSLSFAIISLGASLVSLLFQYFSIVHLRMGFLGFLVADFFSKLFLFLVYSFIVWVKIKLLPNFRISIQHLRGYLSVGLPTIPHAYAAYLLNTSDRLLLSLFAVAVPVIGLYSFAYTFATHFSKIGQSLLIASRPTIMELLATEKRETELQVRNLVWILQAGLLFAGFLLSLWMKEILHYLASNDDLRAAYVYAPFLIMAYTYYPIYFGAINRLYYEEKTGVFWKISFMAAFINISLNLILIPLFNVWGATVTTFISYMYMGFSPYFLKVFKESNRVNYMELFWLFGGLLLTLSVFALKDFSFASKLGTSLFLLVVLWWMVIFFYKTNRGIAHNKNKTQPL